MKKIYRCKGNLSRRYLKGRKDWPYLHNKDYLWLNVSTFLTWELTDTPKNRRNPATEEETKYYYTIQKLNIL